MKKYLPALLFVTVSISALAQSDSWALFAKTKFEAKYSDKAAEYFLYPVFANELKDLIGKEVNLEGYYLPIDIQDDAYIILSKFPYSQCFFFAAEQGLSLLLKYRLRSSLENSKWTSTCG